MIELVIGAMVVSGVLMTVPRAVADAIATHRAAKAGQWDVIDRQRERRADLYREAFARTRRDRHKRIGGDGNYRPGARDYFADLYHDWWADRLEKRRAKRAARPAYQYNPDGSSKRARLTDAMRNKVDRLRESRGFQALIDPAGGPRRDPIRPEPDRSDAPAPHTTPAPQPAPNTTPAPQPAPHKEKDPESDDEENDMTTATGEVHDVETCANECNKLAYDLGTIDVSLDTIDTAVRSAAAAAELIEAWLTGKNFDSNTVAGMALVRDMLGPDKILALIDAVGAAKTGVQNTLDALAPYQEAAGLVGAADGSALNGR